MLRLISQPSSRTGENPPYGMIGRIEETSASFEARSAPRSYPTPDRDDGGRRLRRRRSTPCPVRRARYCLAHLSVPRYQHTAKTELLFTQLCVGISGG